MGSIGRNAPCPCGSGAKYKRCCALQEEKMPFSSRLGIALVGLMLIAGAIFMLTSLDEGDGDITPARVWHGDHWDYPGQTH